MQISVEESGPIERRLTVSVARDKVDREIEKRLRDVAKRARIPGFRPGKAPRNLIQQRYGGQVTQEVVSDTINASYREALSEQAIEPAGLLSIEPQPLVAGDDLRYVAIIELFPSIPSPTLAGRAIEKPRCSIADEDIDRTLQDIRARHASFIPKAGPAENGDRITLDFNGLIDGQPFNGGAAEGHQLVLGEGRMLAEFEGGLAAAKGGDSKRLSVTFPADYPSGEVAGKTAEFAVEVKAVEQRQLPSLDDAFAKKLGISEGGMAKMREEIEISLKRELATRLRSLMRDRVMEELLKANDIEAPTALVESEIDRRIETLKARMAAQESPRQAQQHAIQREPLAAEAKRHVILGLIAREIIEQGGIKADGAIVRARIEEMAGGYDDAEAMINWHYADPARLQQVEAAALEEQLVTRMLESADVTEKEVPFKDLMNPQFA